MESEWRQTYKEQGQVCQQAAGPPGRDLVEHIRDSLVFIQTESVCKLLPDLFSFLEGGCYEGTHTLT